MKRFVHIACLFLLFGALSCKDNEEITPSDQYPEWLQLKITELISNGNDCEITDLTIYEFKGKKYYHIYNGLWSCGYCELYDESGNHLSGTQEERDDFYANKKELKKVPACSVL